jgi:membrane protein DedA with SNARE-associated domain
MLKKIFAPLIAWYLGALKTGGYPLIVLLMAIESSVLPLPSEVVIPPAAHLAYTGQIPLTLWGIVIAGTTGSWIGATAMYWAARVAGRPLFMRYGKLILITPEKISGAERWAANYGAFGIFASRLLPVVRHLIGIPAGIVRMNYVTFSIYTVLGSAMWCGVLCWLGVKVGGDITKGEMHRVTFWVTGFLVVVGALYYFFVHRHMKQKSEEGSQK